jgi:type IV secretory pathway VirB2 component (pilin)
MGSSLIIRTLINFMMMVNNDGIIMISGISSWRRYIRVIIALLLKLGSTNSNKYLTN